jgi:hypothetical protein
MIDTKKLSNIEDFFLLSIINFIEKYLIFKLSIISPKPPNNQSKHHHQRQQISNVWAAINANHCCLCLPADYAGGQHRGKEGQGQKWR